MDRGAWRATVHGVAKSQTLCEHTHICIHSPCNQEGMEVLFSFSIFKIDFIIIIINYFSLQFVWGGHSHGNYAVAAGVGETPR